MNKKICKTLMALSMFLLILGLYFLLEANAKEKRKILYYRHPMKPSIISSVPMKDEMGMDYIPVYEEIQAQQTKPQTKEEGIGQKKIKYWTCGMHPQIKQDKPGNCPLCNMKLIPVYEEEAAPTTEEEKGIIKLSPRDITLAGVKSEAITLRHLFKEIRTVGRIAYDPELYKAEEELIQAIRTQQKLKESQIPEVKERTEALIEAVRLKLRLQGLSNEQIEELSKQEAPDRSLIISDQESPYVWVYADIYEYELSWIKINHPVKVTSISFPGTEFMGKIEAIDPVLNPMTRSVRIRAKIENPELKLKPQMYVDVFIESYLTDDKGEHKIELAVPKDAILDTGMRKIVYLDLGDGSYLGREVKIGPEATAYLDGQKLKFYPVTSGLKEGDTVVTKANFLIDSQSQITGIEAAVYGGALGTE
jgi:hypothetical protein